MWLDSQNVSIKGECCLEIGHGNADMSYAWTVEHRFLQVLRGL
jgi:hypothetical protein